MESHVVKILSADFVTHNVRRFRVEKPAGYHFVPGQATDLSIKAPGLETELRPFTFTSLNGADYLEFTIKIYNDHDGVTRKLGELKAGDELILHEVFGSIAYKGKGVFIAGGAGITPFIAILRQLREDNQLSGNVLLFANQTADDLILHDELKSMLGENYHDVISHPPAPATGTRIDKDLLSRYIDAGSFYYICGPDGFVAGLSGYLEELGVAPEHIVIEK